MKRELTLDEIHEELIFTAVVSGIGLLLLFANFACPILFYLDETNRYSRGDEALAAMAEI